MQPANLRVRPAAVAGRFYPSDPAVLRADIDAMLAAAPDVRGPPPRALIVPHAGYVYSGPIAATAYKHLIGMHPRRVVLLGPAHTVALRGLALPAVDALATPLGPVRIDPAGARIAAALPQVSRSDEAHAREHALEVQLPFLMRALGHEFTLVPLLVGHASPADVADLIDALWDDDTLLIISTDLSHYLSYDDAQVRDAATVRQILDLDDTLASDHACGAHALRGFLQVARRRHLVPRLLDLRSSGDTAGDRRRVVGYAAFAFSSPAPEPA